MAYIGFKRNIYLPWLEEAARLCVASDDLLAIRGQLDSLVGATIHSHDNRRMAIDILMNVWFKTADSHPRLRQEALRLWSQTMEPGDHLWLHYGLTLLAYPFFREAAQAIGQLVRFGDPLTPAMVKQRLMAQRGSPGSLSKAVERVIYSLRQWGLLQETGQRYTYRPSPRLLATQPDLEIWLLACVLAAHPAEELPTDDLLRLPELWPFALTVDLAALRASPLLNIQRAASGWNTARLAE